MIQRAEADGAAAARDSVVAAYCTALAAGGVSGVDERGIRSAMDESERRTRLLYWPDYLHGATPEQMAHQLTRIFPQSR